MESHLIARDPARDLGSDIDKLRATLDRLTRVCDVPVADLVGIDVTSRTSRGETAPAPHARREPDEEPWRATQTQRHAATIARQLVSRAIGPFRRCHYCRAFGARFEQSARGRLAWRCQRCGHRSAAVAVPSAPRLKNPWRDQPKLAAWATVVTVKLREWWAL
jgi:hypothetical protein